MRTISIALITCVLECLVTSQTAQAATEKVLHSFCSQRLCADGEYPLSDLINVNGTLYGTTYQGGANYFGTVFSITPRGKEKLVYSFGATPDGEYPRAGLINFKGKLYGTTYAGGTQRVWGTVFSLDPTTGTENVLYSFRNVTDGAEPFDSLINVKGTLYGTTINGGGRGCAGEGCGTVFSFDPTTDTEKVLRSFVYDTDGEYPRAGLINVKGTLYGTASSGGGVQDDGTVFSITTSGTEKVLHTFGSDDAAMPYASLLNVNGTLYGTTSGGGTIGWGTVFSITPGGMEKVVYSFTGPDGKFPYASLINVNGTLYGTTEEGGTNDAGTVFSITPGGTEKVLHSFGNGTDGVFPCASLINVNGTLYGTTMIGGANGDGTVFSIVP